MKLVSQNYKHNINFYNVKNINYKHISLITNLEIFNICDIVYHSSVLNKFRLDYRNKMDSTVNVRIGAQIENYEITFIFYNNNCFIYKILLIHSKIFWTSVSPIPTFSGYYFYLYPTCLSLSIAIVYL
ncbi:hypothetical protein EDEG_03312 [Edhazardia aedis USNM 41457]|uniref:Uncharacterized protein n=1 Tax=Edhazardia aedis (strain USNM 41457) TaxID=1003232 RepID=J9DLL3_EDHAE|nr:hypothetical protein EDEG_03312 [Edhazardia aedis USNM 41457]|eukprot:EJW02252.1 hypothetical protein EDEG_03312 [Edhazardia aedis USNM 41457]